MSAGTPDCAEIRRRLMDYLKHELTGEAEEEVRQHLAACRHCEGDAEFERNYLRLLEERLRRETCPDQLKARLARIIGQEGG